jgi:hypothetical protein
MCGTVALGQVAKLAFVVVQKELDGVQVKNFIRLWKKGTIDGCEWTGNGGDWLTSETEVKLIVNKGFWPDL